MSAAVPVKKKRVAAKAEQNANGHKRFKSMPMRLTGTTRKPAIAPEGTLKAGAAEEPAAPAPAIEKAPGMGEKRQVSFVQMLVFELRVRDAMTSPFKGLKIPRKFKGRLKTDYPEFLRQDQKFLATPFLSRLVLIPKLNL